jgi:hypothetical protein
MTPSAYSPSGLKINNSVDDPSVVKIDGNKLVIVGPGVASVTAVQSVNSGCFPASSITKVISILEDTIFNVSPSELVLPYSEISSMLSINSNNTWNITCSQAWLKTDHPSGAGNTIVSLEVKENTLDIPRIAFVTIYSLGLPKQIITVTQNNVTLTSIIDSKKIYIQIYPNPTSSILFIRGVEDNYKVTVFDLLGTVVLNNKPINNQLNVSNL